LDENGRLLRDLRPHIIRQECEASLKRLRVDHIDLYQFHWPDPATGTAVEDSWAVMLQLVQEGKVRWVGLSNFDLDDIAKCEGSGHVEFLQPPLSLIERSALGELIPWCERNRTGVVAYSPLASGLLTGKYDRMTIETLAADDWRRRSPNFTEPLLSKNMALIDELSWIATGAGVPLSVLAIAWTLATPGITAAIVGARAPAQVDGWIAAADFELSQTDLAEIEQAIRGTAA
jgi:aryl-alcohol dehydrogenase-like predicted oxidoreductase